MFIGYLLLYLIIFQNCDISLSIVCVCDHVIFNFRRIFIFFTQILHSYIVVEVLGILVFVLDLLTKLGERVIWARFNIFKFNRFFGACAIKAHKFQKFVAPFFFNF